MNNNLFIKTLPISFILFLLLNIIFLPISVSNAANTFNVYYDGTNSNTPDTSVKVTQNVGKGFTLKKHMFSKSNATFKGWYLLKKKDGKTYYYGYTADAGTKSKNKNQKKEAPKPEWLLLSDLVAYHIFSDGEKISNTKCKQLSSGEALHFRGIYTKKNINDSVSSKWKGYEPYTAITNQKSRNYYIAHGGTFPGDGTKYNTITDPVTGINYVKKNNRRYYCIALGTYYGSPGSTHVVVMDNHIGIHIIVADEKGDDAVCKTVNGKKYSLYHTPPGTNQHEYVEFVVNTNITKKNKVSYHGCLNIPFPIYNGNVKGIT